MTDEKKDVAARSSRVAAPPDEHRQRVRDLAASLAKKLPFVAPELLREKIEGYLWTAYDVGASTPNGGTS